MLCNSLFITNGNLLQRIEERLYFYIGRLILFPVSFALHVFSKRDYCEEVGWKAVTADWRQGLPSAVIGFQSNLRDFNEAGHRLLVRACSTIIVCAISTSWTDLHCHCENIFNLKLSLTQIDFMESHVPALLCLYAQKWMKCDNKVKPVQMGSNLIGSPMMDCKSDKVVINKKTILA